MNVALVVRSDRGDRYLPQMRASLGKYVPYPWSAEITVDDRNHELGMAGAVREAWSRLPRTTDYVFDVEEDFVFAAPVDIAAMCRTLEHNTHLAQLVLKRGPGNTAEWEAGGMVEAAADQYEDAPGWLEHKRCFSLNPCVYPYWLTTAGVPFDPLQVGIEGVLTHRFLGEGLVFGVWGRRDDLPMVEHIGWERAPGWRY